MFPYIFVFICLVFSAYLYSYLNYTGKKILSWVILTYIILFVGLRWEVGGDWETYLNYLEQAEQEDFLTVLFLNEPAYMLLNYLFAEFGGILAVNTICASLSILGIWRVSSRILQNPFWGLLVAFPYHIMVVTMGYTRQGTALGCLCLLVEALIRNQRIRALIWFFLGGLFHRTLFFLAPALVITFLMSKNLGLLKRVVISLLVLLTVLCVIMIYSFQLSGQYESYIEREMSSAGAMVRVVLWLPMAILGAGELIRFFKRNNRDEDYSCHILKRVKYIFGYLLIIYFLACLVVYQASTFADRIVLYLLPLILFVMQLLERPHRFIVTTPWLLRFGLVIYAGAIFFGWLLGADHRESWIPYQWALLRN